MKISVALFTVLAGLATAYPFKKEQSDRSGLEFDDARVCDDCLLTPLTMQLAVLISRALPGCREFPPEVGTCVDDSKLIHPAPSPVYREFDL
ncbi:hypothetical protein L249_3303 [Ophiocordyceps polyrhachis-furcata BCC 54312]|uniref:Uncharacterized protein n=1 Tax=Ophiocordyceps polyrhachis-furcata BCC 54312 TaxID=1330021 RepID=A0A367LSI2_9HYPO|nr:hypothetical protein L249_3303 [Ophiocordyceps polyrhachis-furcata BCC 54312]